MPNKLRDTIDFIQNDKVIDQWVKFFKSIESNQCILNVKGSHKFASL